MIVFPGAAEIDVVAALERVREQLILATNDDKIPPFTASFGICGCDDGSSFEDTLLLADRALRAAKTSGKNRVQAFGETIGAPVDADA